MLDDAAHRLYITDTRAGSLTVVDVETKMYAEAITYMGKLSAA